MFVFAAFVSFIIINLYIFFNNYINFGYIILQILKFKYKIRLYYINAFFIPYLFIVFIAAFLISYIIIIIIIILYLFDSGETVFIRKLFIIKAISI